MDGFKSLLDANYTKVFYHVLKQVKNSHNAADITQNTFFKAFIHFRALRNTASQEAWLFTVCNNEIKQFYRSSNKAVLFQEPHNAEDYDELYAAIDLLSSIQRQVVLLKYFGGYTMQEIALLLSVSPMTVKSRLYEARQSLKRILVSPSLQKERRNTLMTNLELCSIGAKTIPCMSLHAQTQLLQCAKENVKFNAEVLEELSNISTGQAFMNSCNGSLSYEELVKILACCDDASIYRLSGSNFTTFRSAPENSLIADIAKLCNTGGFIDSVELIIYVPSMMDTIKWYKKYLNWHCEDDDNHESIEQWQHSIITPYHMEGASQSYQGFKGFHIRPNAIGDMEIQNCHCFVSVSGLEDLHATIAEKGWDKMTEITSYRWGAKGFCLTDLNGFVLEFCEWEC